MIKQFNEVEVRDSAVIYQSGLEQIKKMYAHDPAFAGELAICMCEVALTGQHSSDNYMIDVMLENLKTIAIKDKVKYSKVIESKRQKKILDQELDKIADMLNGGYNQTQIASALNTTKQTISNRVKKIRQDFPELLTSSKMVDSQESSEKFDEDLTSIDTVDEMVGCQEEMVDEELTLDKMVDDLSSKSSVVKYNDNVNDNDNVNVNVTPISSHEEIVGTISLTELNRMGAKFTYVSGSVVEIEGTKKRFRLVDDFSSQF